MVERLAVHGGIVGGRKRSERRGTVLALIEKIRREIRA
jgi:hypothetical protein